MSDYDYQNNNFEGGDIVEGGERNVAEEEVDLLDDVNDNGDVTENSASPGATRKRKAIRASGTKGTAQRAIALFEKYQGLTSDDRKLLSVALGVSEDPRALAVHVACTPKIAVESAELVVALANEADPFAASAFALGLTREQARGMWSLLTHVGAVSVALSSKESQAAVAVARGCAELGAIDPESVRALSVLPDLLDVGE